MMHDFASHTLRSNLSFVFMHFALSPSSGLICIKSRIYEGYSNMFSKSLFARFQHFVESNNVACIQKQLNFE